MCRALDLVEKLLEQAQHDGSMFFERNIDIFLSISQEQPLFAEHCRFTMQEDFIYAPDGRTRHLVWKLSLDELQSPADSTNVATREKCIEHLEAQSIAALRKTHDPQLALRDKQTSQDGSKSYANSTAAHQDLTRDKRRAR